jgi:hypothetical protein
MQEIFTWVIAMKSQKLFFLVVACALAFATLLVASLVSSLFLGWLDSLSEPNAKMVQPLLLLLTAITSVIAVCLRRRRGESDK